MVRFLKIILALGLTIIICGALAAVTIFLTLQFVNDSPTLTATDSPLPPPPTVLFTLPAGTPPPTVIVPAGTDQPTVTVPAGCGEAQAPQLTIGQPAIVTVASDSSLNLRTQPNTEAQIVVILYTDATVTVLAGPICQTNRYWWQIRTSDGLEGWAAESNANRYFLTPAGTPTP